MEKSVEELTLQFKADIKEIIGHDIELWYNIIDNDIPSDLFNIINKVSSYFMVTIDQMRGKRRKRHIVEARQIYCKIAKDTTKYTLQRIADVIVKDHATVLHSVRICNNLIETNKDFKNKYYECKNSK